MNRALGWDGELLVKEETTYGMAAAAGGYFQLPFNSHDLDSTSQLIDSPELGTGRDMDTPVRGAVDVGGDVAFLARVENIGFWLKMLLGAPVTTGSSPNFIHTFTSHKETIPSFTAELGYSKVPRYVQLTGCMVNSMQWNMERTGNVAPVVSIIGQGISENAATQSGTGGDAPTRLAGTRFGTFQGSVKSGGTALGIIESVDFTMSNGLEPVEVIQSNGFIGGIDLGKFGVSGTMVARYENQTLLDAASGNTDISLEFEYEIDSNTGLVITLGKVRLPKVKRSVEGPGGVSVSFEFMAHSTKASMERLLTAVLKNQRASYA